MTWDANEIERIVRDVLRSMIQGAGTVNAPSTPQTSSPATTGSMQHPDGGSLTPRSIYAIASAVVSLESLRSLPAGTECIEIGARALVTPAAKDWCRERNVHLARCSHLDAERDSTPEQNRPKRIAAPELIASVSGLPETMTPRASFGGLSPNDAGSNRPAKLYVSGSVLWLRSLEQQLCPTQTRIDALQLDDAGVIRAVATALRQGHIGAVAIVESPYSALWQAARDEALRPVLISQWSDLADGLREVPTNVLIVPAKRWNIAGTANIARRYLEHIRARS